MRQMIRSTPDGIRKNKTLLGFVGNYEYLSNNYQHILEVSSNGSRNYKYLPDRIYQSALDAYNTAITTTEDWMDFRYEIMKEVVWTKFMSPYFDLGTPLLLTGNWRLINTNTEHDNFWGTCICNTCIGSVSYNNLGKILEFVRMELAY